MSQDIAFCTKIISILVSITYPLLNPDFLILLKYSVWSLISFFNLKHNGNKFIVNDLVEVFLTLGHFEFNYDF